MSEENGKQKSNVDPLAKGVGFGVAIGVCFWLALDNIALGIGLGIAFAVISTQTHKKKIDKDDAR